jgi:hypothetical protein
MANLRQIASLRLQPKILNVKISGCSRSLYDSSTANCISVVLSLVLPLTFWTFHPIANGLFNHMTDYLLCKHKQMAMEDNTENDNDFHDSKSDTRLTGRKSVVGYVVKNTTEDEELAWARLATLFNIRINV